MTARYRVESYADNDDLFYVYEHHAEGNETIHVENLPSREAAEVEALKLNRADALTKAAPDMLAALRDLMADIDGLADEFSICAEISASSYGKAARAAIAAAEGREPGSESC